MIERTFIQKNYNKMEMENYLSKKLERAGFSKLEIIKTPLVTRIVLHVARPGLAIGKSGSTIKQLTETLGVKYAIDNPQIEIQEIKTPNLNAKILAEKMSSMIERGFAWRSVSYRTVKDIMSAGAQGVELVFSGKLAGKGGRKRKQRVAMGYMKKIGDQAKYVDMAKTAAYPKAGAIGIKLSIIHPDVVFPDKIDVKAVIANFKGVKEEAKEQEEVAETKTEDKKEEAKTETKETPKEVAKETKEEKKVEEKKTETKKEDKKEGLLEKIVDKVEDVVEEIKEDVEKVVDKVEEVIEGKPKDAVSSKSEDTAPGSTNGTVEEKVEEKK
jgi:small subunit ribosomal protein S3